MEKTGKPPLKCIILTRSYFHYSQMILNLLAEITSVVMKELLIMRGLKQSHFIFTTAMVCLIAINIHLIYLPFLYPPTHSAKLDELNIKPFITKELNFVWKTAHRYTCLPPDQFEFLKKAVNENDYDGKLFW